MSSNPQTKELYSSSSVQANHILIIDDDDVDRMAISRMLKKAEGIHVTIDEASSSQAGFEALQNKAYECIFLDYQLPDSDGLTLLRKLRSEAIKTPVVMMTGLSDEQLVVEMLHAGASDYLPKAKFSPEKLAQILNNVLRLHQAESQRSEAQENLSKSNARLQYLLDNSPAIIYSAVPSGDFKITFVSDNLRSVLGYEPEEVLEDPNFWFNHIHPDDQYPLMIKMPKLLSAGHQQTHNYRFRHRDGHYLWMHDTIHMVRDDEGCLIEILGSLLDMSERKQLEDTLKREKEEQQILIKELEETRDQLLQSEKMAAIGQLAAGVAHEINNPIGYINSNLSSMQRYLAQLMELVELYQVTEDVFETRHPDILQLIQQVRKRIDLEYCKQDIKDLLSESQEGISRVKKIVKDLKDFSHVDESEWQRVDLHKGLESTLNIINNEIKYKAEVRKEYGSLPLVECLASQVNQVFMNLLVNAAHAIEQQGIITISTGQQDNEVWIEIADNGTGIPEDKIKRIFDPFYTTKPVGVGTGLGLSLSYKIIQKHHGHIDLNSIEGQGTSFKVWLPVEQENGTVDHSDAV